MAEYGTVAVVGASLAGWRAAEALRSAGHAGRIVVIGGERHAPYDRPPLSKQVLTGRIEAEKTALDRHDGLDIDLRLGTIVTGLDLPNRQLRVAGGPSVDFDGLVIATGAHARILPELDTGDGVHLLRTIDDAVALRAGLVDATHVVVIGAGFIGLEVASSARAVGLDVTVVEAAPVPLERAVGAEMGHLIADWHREHGVDVRLGASVAGLVGDDHVRGVRLAPAGDEPQTLPADLVVLGVGAAPTTAWLNGSGVDINDGVRCDSRLRVLAGGVALAHVVAAGDVARWDHPVSGRPTRVEHWTNATEQAYAAVASLLAGDDADVFAPVPYFWSDQFDRKIQMVGQMDPGDEVAVVDGSVADHRFVAAYGRQGRLVAALGFSRAAKVMALQRAIVAGAAFPPEL